MRNRIFAGLSVICAVLLVLTCVLWVRSYWVCDLVQNAQPDGQLAISTTKGVLLWESHRPPAGELLRPPEGDYGWVYRHTPAIDPASTDSGRNATGSFAGFRHAQWTAGNVAAYSYQLPTWCPALLLAIPPLVWLFARRKPAQTQMTRCPACGNELGSQSSSACPQCGAAIDPGRASP